MLVLLLNQRSMDDGASLECTVFLQCLVSEECYFLRFEAQNAQVYQSSYYQQKTKELEKERRMVIGNPSLLEKYAREKYLMKKPKEDIFVIVDENNQPIEH